MTGSMRYTLAKAIVSLFLVVWYFTMPQTGFNGFGCHLYGEMSEHFIYPVCHANVWHLAANILCLWMVPCELHLATSYLLAVLCSFLPCLVSEPTMGFSGVLFAIVGMSWGRVHRLRDMVWRNKWFLVIPVFLPHVNALLHVYCLLAGYFFGRYVKMCKSDWV